MATQDSRIKIKRSTVTATVPTVPSSNDHTDGTWIATDIYKGELFFNQADGVLWSRDDNGVTCLGGSVSLTIASADVLTLNTTPITLVGAVSGYAIEVVSASVNVDFNTTPYATYTGIILITDTATSQQANADIGATVAQIGKFRTTEVGSTSLTQLIANKALTVTVDSGNPTAGDSDITIHVNYRLIPA